MALIKFRTFEAAAELLEKHTVEEIMDGKMLEGREEFQGVNVSEASWLSNVAAGLMNKVTSMIPGTATNRINSVMKEFKDLYSKKAKDQIDAAKERYEIRQKQKGHGDDDSLGAAAKAQLQMLSNKEKNNIDKWDAIQSRLDIKVNDLKKQYRDSPRVQTYIAFKLSDLKVQTYTDLEKEYQKYASEEELAVFTKDVEKEKDNFKKLEAQLKAQADKKEKKAEDNGGDDKKPDVKPEDKKPEAAKAEPKPGDDKKPAEAKPGETDDKVKVGDRYSFELTKDSKTGHGKKGDTRTIVVKRMDGDVPVMGYEGEEDKPGFPLPKEATKIKKEEKK